MLLSAVEFVMVLGGYLQAQRDVELVNFGPNKARTLPKPADLPVNMDGAVSAVVNGKVMTCGGQLTNECYIYSFKENNWTATVPMDRKRIYPASFVLDDEWYILGGTGTNTTLIYRDGVFVQGGDLPYTSTLACAVVVNSTHFFFGGGRSKAGLYTNEYLVDIKSWSWTRIADMSYARESPACGMVGNNIVLGGGQNGMRTSETLSLDTMEWTVGPGIPTYTGKFRNSANVYQLEDTFYVLGGYDEKKKLNTVYEVDAETSAWKLREEKLSTGRSSHTVVPIPNNIIDL